MSGGDYIKREEALRGADEFMSEISSVCERMEIAGSLRRGKEQVHDIEIVVEPKLYRQQKTLIELISDNRTYRNLLHERLTDLLRQRTITRDRPRNDDKSNPFGERYYRITYVPPPDEDGQLIEYPVDLFVVMPPAQWGVIFLIRTGSAEFSHWFVQQGTQYGISVRAGRLVGPTSHDDQNDEYAIMTPEEVDVFRAMHVPYREPQDREMP